METNWKVPDKVTKYSKGLEKEKEAVDLKEEEVES